MAQRHDPAQTHPSPLRHQSSLAPWVVTPWPFRRGQLGAVRVGLGLSAAGAVVAVLTLLLLPGKLCALEGCAGWSRSL